MDGGGGLSRGRVVVGGRGRLGENSGLEHFSRRGESGRTSLSIDLSERRGVFSEVGTREERSLGGRCSCETIIK